MGSARPPVYITRAAHRMATVRRGAARLLCVCGKGRALVVCVCVCAGGGGQMFLYDAIKAREEMSIVSAVSLVRARGAGRQYSDEGARARRRRRMWTRR